MVETGRMAEKGHTRKWRRWKNREEIRSGSVEKGLIAIFSRRQVMPCSSFKFCFIEIFLFTLKKTLYMFLFYKKRVCEGVSSWVVRGGFK